MVMSMTATVPMMLVMIVAMIRLMTMGAMVKLFTPTCPRKDPTHTCTTVQANRTTDPEVADQDAPFMPPMIRPNLYLLKPRLRSQG